MKAAITAAKAELRMVCGYLGSGGNAFADYLLKLHPAAQLVSFEQTRGRYLKDLDGDGFGIPAPAVGRERLNMEFHAELKAALKKGGVVILDSLQYSIPSNRKELLEIVRRQGLVETAFAYWMCEDLRPSCERENARALQSGRPVTDFETYKLQMEAVGQPSLAEGLDKVFLVHSIIARLFAHDSKGTYSLEEVVKEGSAGKAGRQPNLPGSSYSRVPALP